MTAQLPSSLSHADFGLHVSTKPMRGIPKGERTAYSGEFASTKCLGPAPFESLLERDFHTLLCCDPRVLSYAVQPHQLTYWTPGSSAFVRRLYTPDFVAVLHNGTVLIVEVKAYFLTQQKYWHARESYIRTAYWRDQGVQFLVVTERSIRVQPRLSNFELMLRYGARIADLSADIAVRDALVSASGDICIGELCAATQLAQNKIERAYSALMRLALAGEISFDHKYPLTAGSLVLGRSA